ncbi:hypothetical protein R1flu_026176 [Riccia fluitans]|uniref:TPM domain-containing protein n=1 Tax=Riccia fluitans TaxID=41844 RepID=A0ABD1XJ93_9MARC
MTTAVLRPFHGFTEWNFATALSFVPNVLHSLDEVAGKGTRHAFIFETTPIHFPSLFQDLRRSQRKSSDFSMAEVPASLCPLSPLGSHGLYPQLGWSDCIAHTVDNSIPVCLSFGPEIVEELSVRWRDIRGSNGNPIEFIDFLLQLPLSTRNWREIASALGLALSLSGVDIALARPVGVNRPELLPKEFTPVIDVAGFLSPAQEGRITQKVNSLEDETGFKLRVLAQNYPETPGLAIKEFWKVDDNTIVFVADPNMGNILNFNVGALVDLNVPRSFWSRLAGKYGNIFFWREKGEDASIEAAVEAIGVCLREPAGPRACSEIS